MQIGLPAHSQAESETRGEFNVVGREELPVDLREIVTEHRDFPQGVEITKHEIGGCVSGGESVEDSAESGIELIDLIDVVARNLGSELRRVAAANPTQRIADVIRFSGQIPERAGHCAEVSADRQILPTVRNRTGRRNISSQIGPLEIGRLNDVREGAIVRKQRAIDQSRAEDMRANIPPASPVTHSWQN